MTASTAPRSPAFAQVLNQALRLALADVHTGLPAKVTKYDAAKQLVEAQPLVKAVRFDEEGKLVAESYPVIKGVRLQFPGGGGFRTTFPVQVGDLVWLKFAEASLNQWVGNGGEVDPGDVRRFHLADAVAEPGLTSNGNPWTGASTSAATFGKDGGPQVVAKDSSIHLGAKDGDDATEAVLLGTTYADDEKQMLQDVQQQLTTASTDLIQAAANLATAAGRNAIPIYGGAMALQGFVSTVSSLISTSSDLAQAAAKLGIFVAKDATHRSTIVKTK